MTRFQFYSLLVVTGAAGLTFAVRAPAPSSPAGAALAHELSASVKSASDPGSLSEALKQVNRIARADTGASEMQPIAAQLREMPSSEGVDLAIALLTDESPREYGTPTADDRTQIIGFLREHESDDSAQINDFASNDLKLEHLPQNAPKGWRSGYIENVAHLYLETAEDPESRLDDMLQIAAGYSDSSDRMALVGAYLQLFPAKKSAVERAIAGQ